jgi:hypothetical protein
MGDYVNPMNMVNAAIRDQNDQFTKREMMAMHLMGALLPLAFKDSLIADHTHIKNLCITAQQSADILLDTMRNRR